MTPDLIPIQLFVQQKFQSRAIQRVVADWRIEPRLVVEIITDYFREMGIYYADFRHDRDLLRAMLFQLRYSPDIALLHQKAAREENARRQRSRHAD